MIILKELISRFKLYQRIRVFENGKQLFIGMTFDLTVYSEELWERIKDKDVRNIFIYHDITHKNWKELGLMEPQEIENKAEYRFSDLQVQTYQDIYI